MFLSQLERAFSTIAATLAATLPMAVPRAPRADLQQQRQAGIAFMQLGGQEGAMQRNKQRGHGTEGGLPAPAPCGGPAPPGVQSAQAGAGAPPGAHCP